VNKTNRIIEMISRKNGASMKELMQATGWQPHSVRAFFSITRKKLPSVITLTGGRYRLV
jgi:hypothetical protein